MVPAVQSPEILDIVPEHVADPVRRARWPVRLLTGFGDGLLSLLLNGAVVGWMVSVGWPVRPLEAPPAISVDLVDHMPEPKGTEGSSVSSQPSSGPPAGEARTAQEAPSEEHHDDPAKQPAPPEPPPPERKAAAVQPPTEPERQPAPSADASATAPPAVPAAPEHPDNDPAPRLVEAPSAPPPQPAQPQPQQPPPPAPPPTAEATPSPVEAGTPPAEPPVVHTPAEAEAVAPPASPADPPRPLTAEQKRQAENTATLAAMLPFGANINALPMQAAPSASGQGSSASYRGQVYANFNKAQDVIEDAKAKHLKGQAVIAFTIDDKGGLSHLAVAVSSGNPAVDSAALELIRRAAPFPPPPPGAQRSFSPAIGLGLDD